MNCRNFAARAAAVSLLVGCAVAPIMASAHVPVMRAPATAAEPNETTATEVSIQGDRVVEIPAKRWQDDEMVRMSHRVSLAGLDLSKTADLAEARRRIDQTAFAICSHLGNLYPSTSLSVDEKDQADCVSGAVQRAMTQVDAKLASAESARAVG